MKTTCLSAVIVGLTLASASAQQSDIVIADFEGNTYGNWKTTGDAFGTRPAQGKLPNQMDVEGFKGKGLVNSYNGGDDSKGTLTSPSFKIERKYLQFLIGGGGWEGLTCMNLLVDGKVVRTATGPNIQSGGSERLENQQWDVSEYLGRDAIIQIVDQATGTWGHINVDQIVQSDSKINGLVQDAMRSMDVEKSYLNLPIKNGGPKRRMSVLVDGKAEREFDIELADAAPDWWAFLDLTPFKGKQVTFKVAKLPDTSKGLSSIEQSDKIKGDERPYSEALRPQFHFSSKRGWLNDPNGLVFYKGEYHLFYQHNPYGWGWGNMTWGHAVSPDLVHWKELPNALYPDEHGTMFSGSAVVDWKNTAGFQTGDEPALVAFFTAAGRPFTQGIAFSNDKGRTWTKYDKNPVLPHQFGENRDPKVIWHAPENKWVMALYLDRADKRNDYALFSSTDLKSWDKLCDVTIPGDGECPEFFEIAVDGNKQDTRWVFYGASGWYLIGKFDGKTFQAESAPQQMQHGNCWYASQTYTDIPSSDGRRILIPWGRTDGDLHKGMPFNQAMGIPVELKLAKTDEGLRLTVNPVKELESLRGDFQTIKPQTLRPGENPLASTHGELLEVVSELTLGDATEIGFHLRGVGVVYDVKKQELSCGNRKATLKPVNGKIQLRMMVDRTTIDIFGNDGQFYMPMGLVIAPDNKKLEVFAKGGDAQINLLKVYELKSAWK